MSDAPHASPPYRALRIERVGHVLEVTIDHPTSPRNAIDGLLHGELARLFRELKREDDARAVLLTARGRIFSAGGDFAWFPKLRDLASLEHLRRDARQMIWDLLDVPIPIVAAINGPAVGLGASIALLCDVIWMAESATIADPHVQVGITAGAGDGPAPATMRSNVSRSSARTPLRHMFWGMSS